MSRGEGLLRFLLSNGDLAKFLFPRPLCRREPEDLDDEEEEADDEELDLECDRASELEDDDELDDDDDDAERLVAVFASASLLRITELLLLLLDEDETLLRLDFLLASLLVFGSLLLKVIFLRICKPRLYMYFFCT